MAIVPFWGIRVSKINGLPFSGGAPGDGSGAACPKMSKPFILEIRMFIFGTCNRGFRPKTAQTGSKLHKYLCACPFLGHCHFGNKCFPVLRTCNIIRVFIIFTHA